MSNDTLYHIHRQSALRVTPARPSQEGTSDEASLGRRNFMKLLGGGALFASACQQEQPPEILPYTRQPLHVVPGTSQVYATSMEHAGYAGPLLVESREGRPLKVAPHAEHPFNPAGTSVYQEASVWQVYDDWRGRRPRLGSAPASWSQVQEQFDRLRTSDPAGAGLRLIVQPSTSQLQAHTIRGLLSAYPEARVCAYAPLASDNAIQGAEHAFGRRLSPVTELDAKVIVSFDADFLGDSPEALRCARTWAQHRALVSPWDRMNRVYMVEASLSVTGSVADNRLCRRLSDIPTLVRALADRLLTDGAARGQRGGEEDRWVEALAADLRSQRRGTSLILAGERMPPEVFGLVYAMNARLGNIGRTLSFTAPLLADYGAKSMTLGELTNEMRRGDVRTLVMLDTNPVYDAPADLGFADALASVTNTLCFSYYEHETALVCKAYAPTTHFLESWGDGRTPDGTVTLVQPLIRPLVNARSPTEILAHLAGERHAESLRLFRAFWNETQGLSPRQLEAAVQTGFVRGSQATVETPTLQPEFEARALRPNYIQDMARPTLELNFLASPTVYDGRYANIAWLQEQPTPLLKLTWGNAALMSVTTAEARGLQSEQLVSLETATGTLTAPVLVAPGMPDETITVWLGYGRQGQEAIARGVGFNAFRLRSSTQPHHTNVRVEAKKGCERLAITQQHQDLMGRPIAFAETLAFYREHEGFTAPYKGIVPSILPPYPYEGEQWAMTIDTTICTGCSACMVACQAENNVMVVGKEKGAALFGCGFPRGFDVIQ